MKKKLTKKLELSKETLRNLENGQLREAVGGNATNVSCGNGSHCLPEPSMDVC